MSLDLALNETHSLKTSKCLLHPTGQDTGTVCDRTESCGDEPGDTRETFCYTVLELDSHGNVSFSRGGCMRNMNAKCKTTVCRFDKPLTSGSMYNYCCCQGDLCNTLSFYTPTSSWPASAHSPTWPSSYNVDGILASTPRWSSKSKVSSNDNYSIVTYAMIGFSAVSFGVAFFVTSVAVWLWIQMKPRTGH